MSTLNRTVTSVETFSGNFLDYLDPQADLIELADIARGLSLTHRFAAQITRGYSVAEHAVYVRNLLIEDGHVELAFAGLHHDSHEAYLCDWPSPLKHVFRMAGAGEQVDLLERLADVLDVVIGERFGIDVELFQHPILKEADEYAMRREAATLKYSHGIGPHWGYTEALCPLAGIGWSPDHAEREFLRAHEEELKRRA